jgi:hypothetical protein
MSKEEFDEPRAGVRHRPAFAELTSTGVALRRVRERLRLDGCGARRGTAGALGRDAELGLMGIAVDQLPKTDAACAVFRPAGVTES